MGAASVGVALWIGAGVVMLDAEPSDALAAAF